MTMTLTQVTTGGVDENINIDSNTLKVDGTNNRVGIGTAAPGDQLHIHEPSSGASNVRFSSTDVPNGFFVGFDGQERGQIWHTANKDIRIATNNSERMVVKSGGLVGIGTTAPDQLLTLGSAGDTQLKLTTSNSTAHNRINFVNSASSASGGLWYSADNKMEFRTANTERMRIDNSGRLLVGSSTVYSPSGGGSTPVTVVDDGNHRANLVISNQTNHADAGAAVILAAHGQDWQLEATSVLKGNRDFTIKAGTSERLRIDNSGRFLYGTTTGVNLNNASGGSAREAKAYIYNTASVTSERYNLGLITGNNGVAGPTVFLSKTRASSNTHTVVQSGDEVGDIRFSGSDGTYFVEAARIKAKIDGTPGSQDMPGRLEFHTTGDNASSTTERMRIDSSGRLLYGHTTSRSVYGIQAPVQIEGTQFESGSLSITCNNASDFPIVLLGRSRGSSVGSNTALTDGQIIGEVSFVPSDGTNMGSASVRLQGVADDNHGTDDVPGRFIIQVVPDGSESSVERFRLGHDGRVRVTGVYDETTGGSANVNVQQDGLLQRSVSSIKYKKDVETLEDSYADALLNLRPVWYKSKCSSDNPDHGHWGFVAEELAEIDPRLVIWKTSEISWDENGFAVETSCDPEPEGVQYERFVPHLLNLIKRQQQAIATLETKVAALEAAG